MLQVREIIRYQDMTEIPLAPPEVQGLINLRGEIVTAIDLRHRLGVPMEDNDKEPTNVVAWVGSDLVSLLVDQMEDVLELDDAAFEPVPDTLEPEVRELVSGVYKLDGKLLLVLDVEATAEATSRMAGAGA